MDSSEFESCVNPEGYKAGKNLTSLEQEFESCVNPEGYKAVRRFHRLD